MINLTAKFVELYHTLKELLRETKVQVLWVVNHQIDGTAHAFAFYTRIHIFGTNSSLSLVETL